MIETGTPSPAEHNPGHAVVHIGLVVASVLFCLPLLQRLDHYGRSDWDQFTVRYETPRLALLRDRQLPLWNPYVNGGTVLLAHPHSPPASPWYLPVLLLGAPLGLRLQVMLFMALGTTGMAALLRHLGVDHAGCFLGGVLLMMSSHFPLHIAEGHVEWCALGLMPWLLLCVLRGESSRRFLLTGGLLLASVLTFGSVYISAIFLPSLSLRAILEGLRRRSPRPALAWFGMLAVALPVSAVKLLPQLEFTGAFPRPTEQEGFSARGLTTVFLDPRQELLYRAFRDVYLPPESFMLKTIPDAEALPIAHRLGEQGFHWGWHEYGCYLTWLGLGLCILGVIVSWRSQWPLYVVGMVALVTALGHEAPMNFYGWLQRLPLYASMHVPSRFLAFVLFTLTVGAGYGLAWFCRWLSGTRFPSLNSLLSWGIPAAVLLELTVMGWNLFDDIFVCRPTEASRVTGDPSPEFATRVRTTAGVDPRMMSYLFPFLKMNTGVLHGYENLTVSRGEIAVEGEPEYRGEFYLEQESGNVDLQEWTMSRVRINVNVTSPDRLVLNQNAASGWRVRVFSDQGVRRETAVGGPGGLASANVRPGDYEVEFRYLPESFVWGAWVSGVSLLICALAFVCPASSTYFRSRSLRCHPRS